MGQAESSFIGRQRSEHDNSWIDFIYKGMNRCIAPSGTLSGLVFFKSSFEGGLHPQHAINVGAAVAKIRA